MRLYELKDQVKSEVYVDMDGVLVDFFGAWADLMGVNNFRDIKDVETGLAKIRQEDDFWLKLKPTANAGKLLALIKELKGSYNILSSPLADDPRSEPHKRMWVAKYLKQFPPKEVIITSDKAKYAKQSDGTPNILIDDFGQNIQKWNAAGGIGVKHKDHKFERTFKSLMHHLEGKDKIFKREELPQIGKEELEYLTYKKESVDIRKLRPIQVERFEENFTKQMHKYSVGKFKPIIVDEEYRIINGHHRYDVAMYNNLDKVNVYKLENTIYDLHEVIRKLPSGKYRLYSKDGKKNLGTYDTKAGAEKRERQVQYFKHKG